jgi:hypothetical protein
MAEFAAPPAQPPESAASGKPLSPEARRALDEAAARRNAAPQAPALAEEIAGPKGPEPTRYGDWERKGLISDF